MSCCCEGEKKEPKRKEVKQPEVRQGAEKRPFWKKIFKGGEKETSDSV